MKRLLLIILAVLSVSALFAQPGSLSQSVYRSRVNDSTSVVGSTSTGYGYFFWNNQKTVPSWQFWNGTTLVDWSPSASGGGGAGTPQHSYDATGTNTYSTTIDAGNFDGYPGAVVFIKFANTNSGPSSLAVNGGGAVDIVYWDGDSFGPLPSGYLETEIIYRLSYSTIDDFFQLDKWDVTGAVTAVDGTVNRISIGGSAFVPVIDISSSYVGQTSITTLGTISTGTVPGTLVANTPAGNIAATTAQAAINELDAEKQGLYSVFNTQTASYTLILTDVSKTVEMNVASPNDLTVPLNSSVAFPVGTRIRIMQYGSGLTTIVATGGVTLRISSGITSSPGQFCPVVLEKRATDEWYLMNGTPPVGILGVAFGGTGSDNTTQTYTPTLTNTANVAASTARQCTYYRIGNAVTVSGQLDIDPTTTLTTTTLGISLPITSALTTAFQLGGSAAATTVSDNAAGIFSDATNDRATLQYTCVDVTNHTLTFTFTYQVL